LAETIGGSEANFAALMTQQAQRLGMYSSSFHNASGLPDEGQISSARDLAILSAALIHDFPQYYPYFSVTEFEYKGRILPNTNRILKSYPDADGMKTGFTCGSGYNLIASAKRNGHRVIGVLLGGHSSAERFEQMGNLLDVGFEKLSTGNLGSHVAQLKDDDFAPPPFQLSSNRCAGSAIQMGADTGYSSHEPIRIKPNYKHPRVDHVKIASVALHHNSCAKKHSHCHIRAKAEPVIASNSKKPTYLAQTHKKTLQKNLAPSKNTGHSKKSKSHATQNS